MSSPLTRKLEILSNVAVVVAAIALCVVLVRREWFPPPQPGSPESLQGSIINIAALTPEPAERNLVLVLSQTCRFCEQEMPFYQSLSEQLRGHASLLALFPPGEKEPEKYLASRSVHVDRVVSGSYMELGVRGTPTLLLVDARGKIKRAWVGALAPEQHKDVIESVLKL